MAIKIYELIIGVVIVFALHVTAISSKEDVNSVTITVGSDQQTKIIAIPANSTLLVNAAQISKNISAIIFQIHSQIYSLTMFDQLQASVHHKVTGKNIGMLVKMSISESQSSIWLLNENSIKINVLLRISVLNSNDPFPGDCNMEFPTETAPYLILKSDPLRYTLEYQHARLGSGRNKPTYTCSFSSLYITYDIYVSFLEGSDLQEQKYFDKIKTMSDVSSIKELSTKVESYSLHPDTRFTFVKYSNLGVVYNVIAKYTINGEAKEAAYVPIASYGCEPFGFTEYGCRISYSLEGKIILFILSVCGFVVAFFGYLFVGPVVFFFGLVSSFFVSLIVLGKYTSFTPKLTLEVAIGIGTVGALIYLFFWLWTYNLITLYMINGIVFGFLISSIVFYTPIGNLQIFTNSTNFWGIFWTGILSITLLVLIFPKMMTILGSAVVGNYVLLLFYDDFIGTRLSYIVMNILKRAIASQTGFAYNTYPFETKDIIITTVWACLTLLACFIWSRKLSKRNGLFHSSCCFSKQTRRTYTGLIYNAPYNDNIRQPLLVGNTNQNTGLIYNAPYNDNIRQPLLAGNTNQNYQTYQY